MRSQLSKFLDGIDEGAELDHENPGIQKQNTRQPSALLENSDRIGQRSDSQENLSRAENNFQQYMDVGLSGNEA